MSLPNEPIGRRETYLAAIAGQKVQLPASPINREEAYLDEIAKNGGKVYEIKGAYDTEAELETAHPTGNAGDAYLVGDPTHVYVWLTESEEWDDAGEFTAIAGQPGLGIKSVDINASNHLIITYDDDTPEDAGAIDVSVPIDDTEPASNKVYSSQKVENVFLDNKISKDASLSSYEAVGNASVSKNGDAFTVVSTSTSYNGVKYVYSASTLGNKDYTFRGEFRRNQGDANSKITYELKIKTGASSTITAKSFNMPKNISVMPFSFSLSKEYIQEHLYNDELTIMTISSVARDTTESFEMVYGATDETPTLMQLRDDVYAPLNGKKVMFLGDSITELNNERSWVNYFCMMTGAIKLENVAVAQAELPDKNNTVYDGDPKSSVSANNVLGNQVQKIINNQYDAPDIIIIAIGTNGSLTASDSDINASYYDENGVVALADVVRTTPSGAFRYCNETLHNLYPKALICWCSPIQKAWTSSATYSTNYNKGQALKKLTSYGSSFFIDTRECGIRTANENDDANGEYLIDGTHPNVKGAEVIARYNANAICSILGVASRYLDI